MSDSSQLGENMYYYVVKNETKDGYSLVSSYENEGNANLYGKEADSRDYDTTYFVTFDEDFAKVSKEGGDYVVRGILKNKNPEKSGSNGRFVIWGKKNGAWDKTPVSFSQYGVANTTAKSMIKDYEELIIVDEGKPDSTNNFSTTSNIYDD
jgi:hypothetical protein